ncbi:hypothetical protein Prum_036870 [Phytohabitans rumicis]|uniref:Phosphoglycolate phosphatase n=1 Tax=Phytohabitans rumicis TaxID=1076125 RepID=A0A6V8LBK8_9ACTN|nr:hypothetical protein Prum_036870 [Phytohabitans rumicis]
MADRLVVGFDLDMTLVDSRPGIAAAFRALSAQTGVYVDADAAVTRLGPPLRHELRIWFPPERVEEAVDAYRALYPAYAITPSVLLPGAAEAVGAVRDLGGEVVVVTSKLGRLARLHLDHLGLPSRRSPATSSRRARPRPLPSTACASTSATTSRTW